MILEEGDPQEARARALADCAILGTPAEEAFDALVLAAAKCFGVQNAALGFLGPDGYWLKSWLGSVQQLCPVDQSLCAYAVGSGAMLVVADASQDVRFSKFRSVARPRGYRFYAGAPIKTPKGVAVGVICVIDTSPRPGGASDDEAALLTVLAEKAAAQLELRRLSRAQSDLGDCTKSDEPSAPNESEPALTARQTEVLAWAARGKAAAETAEILGVSTRTVRFHLSGACKRLGASRTTTAVARALGLGLIARPGADEE